MLAAELAGLGGRLEGGGAARKGGSGTLDVAGDALAAVAADDGAPARVARLAAVASGGDAALVWRLRDETLEVAGSYGPIVADEELAARGERGRRGAEHGLRRRERSARTSSRCSSASRCSARSRSGFASGRAPDEHGVEQLASFAVRAAHALRSSERARDAGFELERSRALLSVVGEAISQLSLVAHAGDGDRARRPPPRRRPRRRLPDRGRRARRRREPRDRRPAPGGRAAPCSRRRCSRARRVRSSSSTRRATSGSSRCGRTSRSRGSARCWRSASSSATSRSASSPSTRAQRRAAERERAVAADGARGPAGRGRSRTRGCTSDVTTLNDDLKQAARVRAGEVEAAARAARDLAHVRAEPLAADDARRAGVVDRRPARRRRGRDPHARRARDRADRAVGPRQRRARRSGGAGAALAAAAAAACATCSALLRRGEPLILDAELAESFGGALALLAPVPAQGLERRADPDRDADASCSRR